MHSVRRIIILVSVMVWIVSCTEKGEQPPPFPEQEKSNGSLLYEVMQGFEMPPVEFEISDIGKKPPLDYTRYGEFLNLGEENYHFTIKGMEALKRDIGAGIYPNQRGILEDELYQKYRNSQLLNEYHWDVLQSNDRQKAFYIFSQANEMDGVKTFFTASILEKAGHIPQAVKAYYAALVHFPKTPCWSADKSFVWYIGPAAISSLHRLCRDYPELNLELAGARITSQNTKDVDLENDIIKVNPGKLIKKTLPEKIKELPDLNQLKVAETRGTGTVKVIRFENGHWQLRVDGEPYFIRGVSYHPTEVGLGPHTDHQFFDRWMFIDKNRNGKNDSAYDSWVDKNKNDIQDSDEKAIGDFRLLKDMGVNTIRFSVPTTKENTYDSSLVNKSLLRDLYNTYGIRLIMMDFLGAYAVGSGASWEAGTDYTNPEQRQRMKDIVRQKVLDLKDEPFVLMWLLGNENNMIADYSGVNATRTNASLHPVEYAQFLNEAAVMIHELDPNHPVAVGNIELDLLEQYRDYAPAIDILGINSYRGKGGFGNLWQEARAKFDRPILITEYGCDAYHQGAGIDEEAQMQYHVGNLRDIVFNQAGGPYEGNAIGGVIFEFLDEWWKDTWGNPENEQQPEAQFRFPFPDGYDHEEWFGIVSQGNGKQSPFKRQLRKSYHFYKEIWNQ